MKEKEYEVLKTVRIDIEMNRFIKGDSESIGISEAEWIRGACQKEIDIKRGDYLPKLEEKIRRLKKLLKSEEITTSDIYQHRYEKRNTNIQNESSNENQGTRLIMKVVRITEEQDAFIRKEATDLRITQAEYIRRLIENGKTIINMSKEAIIQGKLEELENEKGKFTKNEKEVIGKLEKYGENIKNILRINSNSIQEINNGQSSEVWRNLANMIGIDKKELNRIAIENFGALD